MFVSRSTERNETDQTVVLDVFQIHFLDVVEPIAEEILKGRPNLAVLDLPEVVGQLLHFDRRGHENDLHVRRISQPQGTNEDEEEIHRLVAFVNFVDDDVSEVLQRLGENQFLQEHPGRAIENSGQFAALFVQTGLIADGLADGPAARRRNVFAERARGQASRLRDDDVHRLRSSDVIVQDVLRNLSGFARSRVALQNQNGVLLDQGENLFFLGEGGQILLLVRRLSNVLIVV